MRLIIAGNSHTAALSNGARRLDPPCPASVKLFGFGSGVHETSAFSARRGAKVVMTEPSYAANLLRATGRAEIDDQDVWAVVMGTHNARITRGQFWLEAAPSALAGARLRPVSRGVIGQIVQEDQRHIRSFLEQLQGVGARVLVVSCPPPRRPAQKGVDPQRAATLLALDTAARRAFADWLAERGIPFVPPPEGVADAEGFLLPQFEQRETAKGTPDPHHANADYGVLMVTRILQAVATHFPEACPA